MHHTDAYLSLAAAMPAMPEVAQRLLRSFERDDMTLGDLASLIGRDQMLSGKVMRLANSARYSPARSIASLSDATALLGLQRLRDLTLSACLAGSFPMVAGFDRKRYWQSNLAVASYAQPVATALSVDADTAFIGGLMLRAGQLLMTAAAPREQAAIDLQADRVDSRFDLEATLLGTTHAHITAALARHWRFPDALCTAFDSVAEPLAARPFSRLGAGLRLASVLADAGARMEDPAAALRYTQSPLLDHLRIDMDWLVAHLPDYRLATAGVDELMH